MAAEVEMLFITQASAGVGAKQAVGTAAAGVPLLKLCWAKAACGKPPLRAYHRFVKEAAPSAASQPGLMRTRPGQAGRPSGAIAAAKLTASEGAHRLAAHVRVNCHGACVAVQGTRQQLVRHCSNLMGYARNSKGVPARLSAALLRQLPPLCCRRTQDNSADLGTAQHPPHGEALNVELDQPAKHGAHRCSGTRSPSLGYPGHA